MDKVGNKSGIISWRYDHDKNLWMITRANQEVENYKTQAAFEYLTKPDLQTLIRALYADARADGPGWEFFRKLEREAKNNFSTMKIRRHI
ncbi:hypothetical protein Hanom_Chr11g01003501 [Helianthus anomalus]